MRDVSHIKGVADMRTAVSTHYRSASRHQGTPYLEILSLGMEKLRLETELALLTKRQGRVETRLSEIGQLLEERVAQTQENPPEVDHAGKTGADERETTGRSAPPNLRTMRVEY